MASSIDATKPEQDSYMVSAEIRNNFAAAKEEIEALQSYHSDLIMGAVNDPGEDLIMGNIGA